MGEGLKWGLVSGRECAKWRSVDYAWPSGKTKRGNCGWCRNYGKFSQPKKQRRENDIFSPSRLALTSYAP